MKFAIMNMAQSGIYGRIEATTTDRKRAERLKREWNTDRYTGQRYTTYSIVVVGDSVRKRDELLYRQHGGSDYQHVAA